MITVFVRDREHSCFRESNEKATREQGGAPREQEKYAGRSLFWLLVLVEAQRKGG